MQTLDGVYGDGLRLVLLEHGMDIEERRYRSRSYFRAFVAAQPELYVDLEPTQNLVHLRKALHDLFRRRLADTLKTAVLEGDI
jgi:hypothetical protein